MSKRRLESSARQTSDRTSRRTLFLRNARGETERRNREAGFGNCWRDECRGQRPSRCRCSAASRRERRLPSYDGHPIWLADRRCRTASAASRAKVAARYRSEARFSFHSFGKDQLRLPIWVAEFFFICFFFFIFFFFFFFFVFFFFFLWRKRGRKINVRA